MTFSSAISDSCEFWVDCREWNWVNMGNERISPGLDGGEDDDDDDIS
jgi:hypothetical protein